MRSLSLLVISTLCTAIACAFILESKHREFSRTKEKELQVILDVSFGSISIKQGEQDKIASIDYSEEEAAKQKLYISYDITNEKGTLYIKLKESTRFWGDDDNNNGRNRHLDIKLSSAVFPLPLFPRMAVNSPSLNSALTSRNTTRRRPPSR